MKGDTMLYAIWDNEVAAVLGLGLTEEEARAEAMARRGDSGHTAKAIEALDAEEIAVGVAARWGYVGTLHDYQTGEPIRIATVTEYNASIEAAQSDGGAGVIDVDGRSCYVVE